MEAQLKTVARLPQLFSDNDHYLPIYGVRHGRSYLSVHSLRPGPVVWLDLPITLTEAARLDPYYCKQVDFSCIWYFACQTDFSRPIVFFTMAGGGHYFDRIEARYDDSLADFARFKSDLAAVLDRAAYLANLTPAQILEYASNRHRS